MSAYRIDQWNEYFETAATRKRHGLDWVKLPIRLSGVSYRRIASQKGGAAALGVWMALLEVAAQQRAPRDGTLQDGSGKPYDVHDLSLCTSIPTKTITAALTLLGAEGWVVSANGLPVGGRNLPGCGKNLPLEERRGEEIREEETRGDERADVGEVCHHYSTLHPDAKPSAQTRDKIRARLKDGYTVADLCAAIDGNHRSPHHCGENDRGTKYHSLELIVRDPEHVQQFLEVPEMTPSTTAIKNRRVAENWVRLKERQDAQ